MHTRLFETMIDKPECIDDVSEIYSDTAFESLSIMGLCDYCYYLGNEKLGDDLDGLSIRFGIDFDKYIDEDGKEFFGLSQENISKFVNKFLDDKIEEAEKGQKLLDDYLQNLKDTKNGVTNYDRMKGWYIKNMVENKDDYLFYNEYFNHGTLLEFVMYLSTCGIKQIYFVQTFDVHN